MSTMQSGLDAAAKSGQQTVSPASLGVIASCSLAVVSTPEELRAQAEAVARVRAAHLRREQAQDEFVREIRTAYRLGASMADIAIAAGLTRQRVWQIVRNEPPPI